MLYETYTCRKAIDVAWYNQLNETKLRREKHEADTRAQICKWVQRPHLYFNSKIVGLTKTIVDSSINSKKKETHT